MKALGEVADAIVKGGVPLALFGYMALRAHLNRIGIPSTTPLGLERYLAETFLLVTNLLLPVVLVVAALGAVAAVVHLFRRMLPPKAVTVVALIVRKPRREWALLIVLVIAYLVLLRRISATWPSDVAVGGLSAARLGMPSGESTMIWLVFVTLGGTTVLRADTPSGEPAARTLPWQMACVMLMVLAAHVPLVFGWAVRPALYPVTRADLKEPTEIVCGLLVIETAEELRLWQASNRHGHIVRVPRTRIIRIEAGPVDDLLDDARQAVGGAAVPVCP